MLKKKPLNAGRIQRRYYYVFSHLWQKLFCFVFRLELLRARRVHTYADSGTLMLKLNKFFVLCIFNLSRVILYCECIFS